MRFDLEKKKLVPKEPEEDNKKASSAKDAKKNSQSNCNTEKEIKADRRWKEIIGYEEIYAVSDLGEVKSLRFNRTLKPSSHGRLKYDRVSLCKDGECETFYVHRLVAGAFFGYEEELEVNHIDGNKQNNTLSNLEWVSRRENVLHAHSMGLAGVGTKNQVRGSRVGTSKLTEEQVRKIKRNGNNYNYKELAKMFSVSKGTIRGILKNETWKHVKGN